MIPQEFFGVPSTMLGASSHYSYLLLQKSYEISNYHPHFTDEESETWTLKQLAHYTASLYS